VITLRNATHLAYTYIPLVFQSNQLGERMASYFTKAWFDWKLKGDRSGYARLTAQQFDDSVDRTSIGAGTYDPAQADPTNPYSGNVPYLIDGIPVSDAVSFYYRSAYALHAPGSGRLRVCDDMRAGCPGDPAPDAPAATSPSSGDAVVGSRTQALQFAVRVKARRLRAALKRGLVATATCSAPCTLEIAVKAGGRTLATGRIARPFSGSKTVRLRFTKAAKRRLRSASKLRAALVVTAHDTSGATGTSRGKLEVKR
jgi:hypothetical protein